MTVWLQGRPGLCRGRRGEPGSRAAAVLAGRNLGRTHRRTATRARGEGTASAGQGQGPRGGRPRARCVWSSEALLPCEPLVCGVSHGSSGKTAPLVTLVPIKLYLQKGCPGRDGHRSGRGRVAPRSGVRSASQEGRAAPRPGPPRGLESETHPKRRGDAASSRRKAHVAWPSPLPMARQSARAPGNGASSPDGRVWAVALPVRRPRGSISHLTGPRRLAPAWHPVAMLTRKPAPGGRSVGSRQVTPRHKILNQT